jgi:hypothetical protein
MAVKHWIYGGIAALVLGANIYLFRNQITSGARYVLNPSALDVKCLDFGAAGTLCNLIGVDNNNNGVLYQPLVDQAGNITSFEKYSTSNLKLTVDLNTKKVSLDKSAITGTATF